VSEVHRYRLCGVPGAYAHTPYFFVHGVSYVDERLMMYRDSDSRPYYYVVDRMYP